MPLSLAVLPALSCRGTFVSSPFPCTVPTLPPFFISHLSCCRIDCFSMVARGILVCQTRPWMSLARSTSPPPLLLYVFYMTPSVACSGTFLLSALVRVPFRRSLDILHDGSVAFVIGSAFTRPAGLPFLHLLINISSLVIFCSTQPFAFCFS